VGSDICIRDRAYALHFYEERHRLTAIDLDEKMIEELKEKNSTIDARVMDMLDINQLGKKFDLIYCIGNSIVHLDSLELIEEFFDTSYNQLKNGASLLIQVVNYDRIIDKDIKSLPTIQNHEAKLTFIREYSFLEDEQKIAFHTKLQISDAVYENTVNLLPIRSQELVKSLLKVGFKNVAMYGDFSDHTYNALESMACVIIAEKI
jgi:SAM-dependent methyltransferase